ncbi:GNAT family N-acetyltransferase [Gallibacterium sp. ZY190522]
MTTFTVRKARPEDTQSIENLIQAAFADMPLSDGQESLLVHNLNANHDVVLELVAVQAGEIIGHILFSPATICGQSVLALAPLSVAPQWQRQGVGKALILAAHRQIKTMNYAAIVVLGHPDYYARFGYLPAEDYNISAPFELPEGVLRVLPLVKNMPQGEIHYATAFGLN